MELGSTPVLISFRPVAAPTRYLAACTNKSRALKEDFDVRCVQEKSNDTYFIIQQVKEKVYVIKSAAKPNHYLFCSNDDTRKHEDDFDVRTHSFQEARNNWIIESHGWSVFTIRSETNPNHFLFVATDKSNKLDKDFDVRTQNKENQNNHWYLVTNPTFTTPYPLKHEPLIVTFNPAHLPQHSLTIGDTHQSFTDDFSVNVQQNNNQHSKFILDRVTGDAFAIRSFQYPSFYLYVDNKKELNKFHDYDVRFHPVKDLRNVWLIEQTESNHWTIRSLTNPNQYLFAVQDEPKNNSSFPIRAHPFQEDRNQWIIDGLLQY
ncbi:unnamed protein product (macronuclear) [Paramecium tetraurelia]|uniref:Ricin B lectin domain-containing protein n=1 Tax=Paramecium tetraurelia TaxID=5888 RepID=A0CZM3_PARTE|nr:uncharacterized protein GSPATT00011813001 [Paramecium tetraurelia]CAK76240.1 unnamed protein product [Paramecium tetraurelia]|eukprot:XP_001443637.1 hypothetical protein (macronuclear) [Paramecium tetraurelia strain d4-2]